MQKKQQTHHWQMFVVRYLETDWTKGQGMHQPLVFFSSSTSHTSPIRANFGDLKKIRPYSCRSGQPCAFDPWFNSSVHHYRPKPRKSPEAILLRETATTNCSKSLVGKRISRFGVPLAMSSNRGSRFTSVLWGELSWQLGVKLHHTTEYHTASKDLVARFHRSFNLY